MCKLCNSTNRTTKKSTVKVQVMKVFAAAVKDYTGEYPCKACRSAYANHRKRVTVDDNTDYWIARRLFKRYSLQSSVRERKRATHKANTEVSKEKPAYSKDYTAAYNRDNVKYERIEKGIRKMCNKKSGKVTFRYRKHTSQVKISETFKTLKEAQNYKQRILNDN